MATIEDLEKRVEALEMDLPMRRGIVAHLHQQDMRFQRLDEGQQRHEHQIRELIKKFDGLENKFDALETKVDAGFLRLDRKIDTCLSRLDQKLDILLGQSKIHLN